MADETNENDSPDLEERRRMVFENRRRRADRATPGFQEISVGSRGHFFDKVAKLLAVKSIRIPAAKVQEYEQLAYAWGDAVGNMTVGPYCGSFIGHTPAVPLVPRVYVNHCPPVNLTDDHLAALADTGMPPLPDGELALYPKMELTCCIHELPDLGPVVAGLIDAAATRGDPELREVPAHLKAVASPDGAGRLNLWTDAARRMVGKLASPWPASRLP